MHEKIRLYIEKRKQEVNVDTLNREELKDKKSAELNAEKDKILEQKEEAYKETQKMEALCQEQEDERRQREAKD